MARERKAREEFLEKTMNIKTPRSMKENPDKTDRVLEVHSFFLIFVLFHLESRLIHSGFRVCWRQFTVPESLKGLRPQLS